MTSPPKKATSDSNMPPASELPAHLDASIARQLVNQSIAVNRELQSQHAALRHALAVKLAASLLAHIGKEAQRSRTQTEYIIRDRAIPAEHREEVLQMVKNSLDTRGFNILTYWQYSVFGSGTIFQIEW